MTNDNLGPYAEFPHPHEIRMIRILPASIERVWACLTDAEKRATWLAAGPMDPRCGGHVHLHFDSAALSPDETAPDTWEECPGRGDFEGLVTRCDPPNVLRVTWNGSEVSFELTCLRDETRLVLTHGPLRGTEEIVSVAAGWHVHLAFLLARLTCQPPPLFWANYARLADEYATRLGAATVG